MKNWAMIAAIQLLEYLHTPDICNPLQCKHMIQRLFFFLNARKQANLSTKKETKQKPAFRSTYNCLYD